MKYVWGGLAEYCIRASIQICPYHEGIHCEMPTMRVTLDSAPQQATSSLQDSAVVSHTKHDPSNSIVQQRHVARGARIASLQPCRVSTLELSGPSAHEAIENRTAHRLARDWKINNGVESFRNNLRVSQLCQVAIKFSRRKEVSQWQAQSLVCPKERRRRAL